MNNNENIITKIKKRDDVNFTLGSEIDDIINCIDKADLPTL